MAFSPLTQLIALFSGTGKLINRGGAKGATSAADVTSRAIDADHQALDTYDASAASIDTKLPAAAAMTSDAEAASNTSRIGTRGQAWDDTQNSGAGGWSKIRAGLAKLTAASGKRSDAVGLLQMLPFARYIQAADRPVLTTQDPVHLISNGRGDLATQEQYQPVYENNVEGYAEVAIFPRGTTTGQLTMTDSAALENSHVCMNGAGRLYCADGRHETYTLAGTIVALNGTFEVQLAPQAQLVTFVVAGTWVGTLQFEFFDGQTWVTLTVNPTGGGGGVTTTAANGAWNYAITTPVPGGKIRCKATAWTSGTANITLGGAIQLYWQAHNSATVPADGAVPKISVPLAPLQPLPLLCQDDVFGRGFTAGVIWCLSTTGATKTIANGAGGWFNVGTKQ